MHDQPSSYAGVIGAGTILERAPQLDAIYYQANEMAICAMAYLPMHGIRVKHDIGVAGWGAMEANAILPERLTTADVPAAAIGKIASEMLVKRLKGNVVQDINAVPTRLIPSNTI